jgi:hypothetical protein
MVRSGGVGMSTDLPDFKIFCRDACIKLWGEPDRETAKELRWSGDDAYSERTFDQRKGVWFDAGQERGGSTLELTLYAKSKPPVEKGKLRGALFFEAWTDAFELGLVPDPPSRPFAAPPDVPEDRAKALQAAFLAVHRDLQYLDEATRLKIDISPIGGEEVLRAIAQIAAAPPELLGYMKKLLVEK